MQQPVIAQMKLNVEKILLVLRSHAIWGSLHGFHRIFIAHNHQLRLIWIVIMTVFVFIFCYCLGVSYQEHFVTRPTVTSMRYIRQEEIMFPDVLVCPLMAYHSLAMQEVPPTIGELFSFVGFSTLNPLYAGFRNELAKNLTLAFHKYPAMQNNWKKFYIQNPLTQTLG